jgi:hypothetical protein
MFSSRSFLSSHFPVRKHRVHGGEAARARATQQQKSGSNDEMHILVRAHAEKQKFSTTVEEGEDAISFQEALAEVLGRNMTGLVKDGKKGGGKKGRKGKEEGGGKEDDMVVVMEESSRGGPGGERGGKRKKRR